MPPARPSGTSSSWRSVRAHHAVAAIGAALALMMVVVLVAALVRDDANVGDLALIELQIRDVLSSNTPLVGAYSRYGWWHPGPLMFDVFAVPYRVLGNDATALRLTTLLFNAAVLVVLMWLLWRRGIAATMALGTSTILLVWGLPAEALSYGWNVTVADLPMVVVLVGCWCALCGDRGALLAASLAASFAVQAHVGVGVVLGPLVIAAIAIVAHRSVRDGLDVRRWAIGTGVVVLTFVPTVLDTVVHWPGNTADIVRWSISNDEPTVGLRDGAALVGRASSLSFPFAPQIPGRFVLDVDTIEVGVLPGLAVALLVAGWALASRRGWTAERTLCAVLLGVWACGLVAARSITHPLGWWLVDWLQPLAWTTWGAIALVALRELQRVAGSRTGALTAMALGVWLALVGFAVVAHAVDVSGAADRAAEFVRPVTSLTNAAESVTSPGDVVRLDFVGTPLHAETMMSGVANRLDASGRDVCVDPAYAYRFGSHRVCSTEPDVHLVVRSEPSAEPPPAFDGRSTTQLAVVDPVTAAERDEVDAITADIALILERDGRTHEIGVLDTELAGAVLVGSPSDELVAQADRIARVEELRRVPGVRYGIYLVD